MTGLATTTDNVRFNCSLSLTRPISSIEQRAGYMSIKHCKLPSTSASVEPEADTVNRWPELNSAQQNTPRNQPNVIGRGDERCGRGLRVNYRVAISSAPSFQFAALTLASSWTGEVTPAITEHMSGFERSQAIANSPIVWPRSVAQASYL